MTVLPAAQLRSQIDSKADKSAMSPRSRVEKKSARKLIDVCLNKSVKQTKLTEKKLADLAFKPREASQIKIPRSQIPCCSRCGSLTDIVSGATFIHENEEIIKNSPLALWQCHYCRNYEVTKASLVLLFKRLLGRRKGSDVAFDVQRRPTFTRHGKILISNGDHNYICYVPVKVHSL